MWRIPWIQDRHRLLLVSLAWHRVFSSTYLLSIYRRCRIRHPCVLGYNMEGRAGQSSSRVEGPYEFILYWREDGVYLESVVTNWASLLLVSIRTFDGLQPTEY